MIGGVSGVREDIIPFGLAAGSFARLSGTQCRRNETKSVFRRSHPHRSISISSDIFPQRLMAQHLDDAESKYGNNPSVAHLVAFIRNKGRQAICPPRYLRKGFMTTVGRRRFLVQSHIERVTPFATAFTASRRSRSARWEGSAHLAAGGVAAKTKGRQVPAPVGLVGARRADSSYPTGTVAGPVSLASQPQVIKTEGRPGFRQTRHTLHME
jgi:hypothetical protein